MLQASDVEQFQREGAICLRQVLNAEEVAVLREGIEHNLTALSPRAKVASRADDKGRFVEDFCNWRENRWYSQLAHSSALGEIAGRLMGSRSARFYHDHLLVKEPGTQQRTPWHQDQPYFNVEGRQNVSFWIPADPVERPSTLEFVAGSHAGTWFMPRSFLDSKANWFPDGTLEELPDIDGDPSRHRILGWQMQPGDVLAFHMLTLHAAGGVGISHRRRVLSLRYLGDDATHIVRPWKTSPEFPNLATELPSGAPMDHPLFPIVWMDDTRRV